MSIKAFFIASEVRSGSTYIAEVISYSLFESYGVECWDLTKEKFSELAINASPHIAKSIISSTFISQAGFRSSKFLVKDLVGLMGATNEDQALASEFFSNDCAWLIVRRRDKFRQAVSLAFAENSGVYHHYGDPNDALDSGIEISPREVLPHFHSISISDDYLRLFADHVPLSFTLFYEDFIRNPKQAMKIFLSELEIPVKVEELVLSEPKIVQTRNEAKILLVEEFKEYFLRSYK